MQNEIYDEKNQLLAFQLDKLAAGRLFEQDSGHAGDEAIKPLAHNQRGVGKRHFRLVYNFLVPFLANQWQFIEPVDNILDIREGEQFYF